MAHNDKPVIVKLSCEANPGTDTTEFDRAEWDAMAPTERAVALDDAVDTHIGNQGGGSYYIADPDDEAMVGQAPGYGALLELAEWLVSLGEVVPGPAESPPTMDEIITRAREALGRKED